MRAWLIRIETAIGGFSSLLLLFLGAYQLISEYLVPSLVISWIPEIMVYLMVWNVFFVCGLLVAEHGHIRADFFVSMMGPRMSRAIALFNTLAGIFFTAILVWQGLEVVKANRAMGMTGVSELAFPMWLYSASIVFGAGLMCLHYIDQAILNLRGKELPIEGVIP